MSSLRHEAVAFRPLESISAATLSALSRAWPRFSMANMAFRMKVVHFVCLWLTLESTLRMNAPCTAGSAPRRHRADRGDELGAPVADHQAYAPAIIERMNCSQLLRFSFMPSTTPMTLR